MAFIKIAAGDFKEGKDSEWRGGFDNYFLMKNEEQFSREKISVTEIEEIEVASEESVKRLGGTIGWGIAGAALFGGAGLVAGLISGGQGKDITVVCKFKDGRKFLGSMSSKAFAEIQARLFDIAHGKGVKKRKPAPKWQKIILCVLGIPLLLLILAVIFVKP